MFKFKRKHPNPIGTVLIYITPKKTIKIKNREIFETEDEKLAKKLRKDPELEEIKGQKNEKDEEEE